MTRDRPALPRAQDDLTEVEICSYSGHLAGDACPDRVKVRAPIHAVPTAPCPYHQAYDVDRATGHAVLPACRKPDRTYDRKTFVVLPSAFGGILTGTTLAVARAAGETAPIIFTSAVYANSVSFNPTEALASIPFTIFTYSEAPDKSLNDQAWAAAFVLMAFVLVSSLTARYFLSRHQRKLLGR